MASSKITLSEASRLTGKDKTTLFKWVKSGKMSATREGKIWMVDPSELHRVTGFVIEKSTMNSMVDSMTVNDSNKSTVTGSRAPSSLNSMNNQRSEFNDNSMTVNAQIASLETEVRLLREMNTDLKTRLDRAEEDRRKVTFLLEHQLDRNPQSLNQETHTEVPGMPVEEQTEKSGTEVAGQVEKGRLWRLLGLK